MKSKREIGKELEILVADRLSEVLNDITIKPTKASGASTQLGDILNKDFIIECKKRNTKNITINENVWDKLLAELPIDSLRIPLYILENKNKKRWVVLDFNDFCTLIKEG